MMINGEVCETKLIVHSWKHFWNIRSKRQTSFWQVLHDISFLLSLFHAHMHYASLRFSFMWSMRAQGGDGVWFHFLCILWPLFFCFFLSLHVIEIFVLLKHKGTRRRWSLTPILYVFRPILALLLCLLVFIDLCLALCPLFVLPLQHH
jgi:hypothetical protein